VCFPDFPRRPSAWLACCLVASLWLWACPESPNTRSDAWSVPGDGPATAVEMVDKQAMIHALQGLWRVQSPAGSTLWEFVIDGDRAESIDHRYSREIRRWGELLIRTAHGFGIRGEDGVAYYYTAVLEPGSERIGLGAAIHVGQEEAFEAKLGAFEVLVRAADGVCTYQRRWAGTIQQVEVACGFEERGEQRIFHYEAQDPFNREKLRRQELIVVGDYLMGRELADAIATRVPVPDDRRLDGPRAVGGEGQPATADASSSPEPPPQVEGAEPEEAAPEAGPDEAPAQADDEAAPSEAPAAPTP
jgi:hypothetical protein